MCLLLLLLPPVVKEAEGGNMITACISKDGVARREFTNRGQNLLPLKAYKYVGKHTRVPVELLSYNRQHF
jgi:hypothetical protein